MNAFEKLAFEQMTSFDRLNQVLAKGLEFLDAAKLLTSADLKLLNTLEDAMQRLEEIQKKEVIDNGNR